MMKNKKEVGKEVGKEAGRYFLESLLSLTSLEKEGTLERNRELYQMGVSLRNVFDELDYTFKVFLGLYKYYHSEIKQLALKNDGSIDIMVIKRELLNYLSKIKKYDEDIAREMLKVVLESDLFEIDYELYQSLLYEVKETFKVELLQQIPPAVRGNLYFIEGFGKNGNKVLKYLIEEKEKRVRKLEKMLETKNQIEVVDDAVEEEEIEKEIEV